MYASFYAIWESSSAASLSPDGYSFFWVLGCSNSSDPGWKTMPFWNIEKNWKRSHRIATSSCILILPLEIASFVGGLVTEGGRYFFQEVYLSVRLYGSEYGLPPFSAIHLSPQNHIKPRQSAHQPICPRAYLPWCL